MKSFRSILVSLVVTGAALAAVPPMTGCYATEAAYVVEGSPPPRRHEVVVYRPGHVWVHGRWTHPGRHWRWQSGYYVRERPNYTYVEGRWERRGRGHVWVSGTWQPRRGVVIRDRR